MLIYNGVNFKNRFNGDFRIIQIFGRGPAPQESNLLVIPGRMGAFHRFKRRNAKTISVSFELRSSSRSDLLEKVRLLSEILDVDTPVPLALPNENGLIRYAIMDGEPDWEELFHKGRGTIHFLCPDPYAYGQETLQDLTALKTVANDGTAETYPIFEVDVLEPITRLEITNQSIKDRQGNHPSIVLGELSDVEQTEIPREELVLHDTMQSTANWTTASRVDNGFVTGEIGTDPVKGFYPERYGEVVQDKVWQGPSLVRGIPPLQDFRMDARVRMRNRTLSYETGMLEIYLLDANGSTVAKIGIEDRWVDAERIFAKSQLGGQNGPMIAQEYADNPNNWNNFNGLLRLERVGNVWHPYITVIDERGNHIWTRGRLRHTDINGDYMAPISQIQVAMRKFPDTKAVDQSIMEIKMFRINEPEDENETNYIALAGDKITIDTRTGQVRKNGEIANDLLDLQTRMFPLQKGYNRFEISNGINVKARYRKAYL